MMKARMIVREKWCDYNYPLLIVILVYCVLFSLKCVDCKRKNVLLIVVDDLRPALGCYGDRQAFTPNIDLLAAHSATFTRAYAQQALCGPSRSSLLTSRSPHHLGQYDVHKYWRTSAGNFTSLPQYFRENGYHTMSIGKVFHPGKCSNFVDDQPFSWSQTPFHPSTQKNKNDAVCPSVNGRGPSRSIVCPVNVKDQPGRTLPDLESLDAAEKYLHTHMIRNSEQPFFLAVGFHKPHIPLKFPQDYLEYHPLKNIPLPQMRMRPPNLPTSAWNPWNDMRLRDDINALNISFPWETMPDHWALKVKQSYYASVTYMDDLVGKLLQKLDETGQRNSTIILLTSDHGWSIGEHGEWSKYSNYEISTHVPFILSIPGKVGVQIDHLVELLDIFPTLVDLAGIEKGLPRCESYDEILCTDGRSLKVILDKKNKKALMEWRRGAFSQYPRPGVYPSQHPDSDQPHLQDIKVMGYSVRTGQHRFTEWVQFDVEKNVPVWNHVFGSELYDHRLDIDENLNLSNREYLKPLIASLREMLYLRWNV